MTETCQWNRPMKDGEGVRTYRAWGKANLDDVAWSEVGTGDEEATP